MKKSIILAFCILLVTSGWLLSGQIGNVNAEDKKSYTATNSTEADNTNNSEKKFNELIKVETKVFTSEPIDQSITLQGQTIHNRSIDIKSQTTGNIVEINFKRGDSVKSKQKLISISIEDRKELYNSYVKELDRLQKELNIIKKNRDNLLNKNAELIKLYEIEFASAKQLIDKGLSSKSKLSLASFNLAQAKSDKVDINLNYESQLSSIEAQIESSKSKIKNIQIDINKTEVKVPFDGIINKKNVEIGDYVRPGDILFSLVDLNPIKIQGYLSEFDVNKVNVGTKAKVENTNSILKIGEVTFISPSAETSTRTFEFTIEADNTDLAFKSGITTSITIEGSELLAHKIPPSILTLQDDGTVGVKALNQKNYVVFYPIKTVKDTVDGMWVSGLPNQVNLIVSGQEYVSIGQQINPE